MRPCCLLQAAGRIHRLGQSKEVLVKKFVFRDSIDDAIHQLHAKIKAGEITMCEDGGFPTEALALFRKAGVAQPHVADKKAPVVTTQRRYRSNLKRNWRTYGGQGGFDYGKAVDTRPCLCCGKPVELPGTSVWWGKGRLAYLDGNKEETPRIQGGRNSIGDE